MRRLGLFTLLFYRLELKRVAYREVGEFQFLTPRFRVREEPAGRDHDVAVCREVGNLCVFWEGGNLCPQEFRIGHLARNRSRPDEPVQFFLVRIAPRAPRACVCGADGLMRLLRILALGFKLPGGNKLCAELFFNHARNNGEHKLRERR